MRRIRACEIGAATNQAETARDDACETVLLFGNLNAVYGYGMGDNGVDVRQLRTQRDGPAACRSAASTIVDELFSAEPLKRCLTELFAKFGEGIPF